MVDGNTDWFDSEERAAKSAAVATAARLNREVLIVSIVAIVVSLATTLLMRALR